MALLISRSLVWLRAALGLLAISASLTGGHVWSTSLLLVFFGGFEVYASILTALNASCGREDRSWLGALCAAGYIAGGLLSPLGDAGSAMTWLGIASLLVLLALTVGLGRGYSSGAPIWGCVQDRGAYSIVRHPMAAWHLVSRCLIVAAWPSPANALLCLVCAGFVVAGVLIEERFLRSASEGQYDEYCARVRYRFLPGVF